MGLFFVDLLRNPPAVAEVVTGKLKGMFEKYEGPDALAAYPLVPIQVLQNAARGSSLTFSPERMDYAYYRVGGNEINFERFINDAIMIAREVTACKPIGRVGLVASMFDAKDNPSDNILKKYFKLKCSKNTQEVMFRTNSKKHYKKMLINNITSVEAVNNILLDETSQQGIVVVRDINCEFNPSGISYDFVCGFIKDHKQDLLNYY